MQRAGPGDDGCRARPDGAGLAGGDRRGRTASAHAVHFSGAVSSPPVWRPRNAGERPRSRGRIPHAHAVHPPTHRASPSASAVRSARPACREHPVDRRSAANHSPGRDPERDSRVQCVWELRRSSGGERDAVPGMRTGPQPIDTALLILRELLAVLQSITGLDGQRARWLLDVVALLLPWILLPLVDRVARRSR